MFGLKLWIDQKPSQDRTPTVVGWTQVRVCKSDQDALASLLKNEVISGLEFALEDCWRRVTSEELVRRSAFYWQFAVGIQRAATVIQELRERWRKMGAS